MSAVPLMRRSIISAFRDLSPPRVAADTGIKFAAYLHSFFDRAAVIDALTEAEWVVLSKFGAYLRQTARTSIRKGNRKGDPSPPGTPPRSHDVWLDNGGRAKHLLREMMFFGFDANRRTVVVGPAVINAPTGAPGLCEFGGTVTRPVAGGGFVQVTYPPRPYMAPALVKEAPRFPQLFSGTFGGRASVRGG